MENKSLWGAMIRVNKSKKKIADLQVTVCLLSVWILNKENVKTYTQALFSAAEKKILITKSLFTLAHVETLIFTKMTSLFQKQIKRVG